MWQFDTNRFNHIYVRLCLVCTHNSKQNEQVVKILLTQYHMCKRVLNEKSKLYSDRTERYVFVYIHYILYI